MVLLIEIWVVRVRCSINGLLEWYWVIIKRERESLFLSFFLFFSQVKVAVMRRCGVGMVSLIETCVVKVR